MTSEVNFRRSDYLTEMHNKISALGPDYDAQANQVMLTIVRASNLLTSDLNSSVWRPFGVSYAGFRVLLVIWAHGPMEPRVISRLASVSRASISSVINTLERDGYVERRRESADRRLVTVALTQKGKELWHQSFDQHNAREQRWTQSLTKKEQQTLTRLLQKLINNRPRSEEELSDAQ